MIHEIKTQSNEMNEMNELNVSDFNNDKNSYFSFGDKFYGILRMDYEKSTIRVATHDIRTGETTNYEPFTRIDYWELKNKDICVDWITKFLFFDVTDKTFGISSDFPFLVSWVDANCVCLTKNEFFVYLVFSVSENYQTGIFIFDIASNSFVNSDVFVSEDYECEYYDDNENAKTITQKRFTNPYKSLHEKDIEECCCFNGELYVCIDGELCKYNVTTDELMNYIKPTEPMETIFNVGMNEKFVLFVNFNKICVYANDNINNLIYEKEFHGLDIVLATVIDDELVVLVKKAENPYGQIYQETRRYEGFNVMKMRLID